MGNQTANSIKVRNDQKENLGQKCSSCLGNLSEYELTNPSKLDIFQKNVFVPVCGSCFSKFGGYNTLLRGGLGYRINDGELIVDYGVLPNSMEQKVNELVDSILEADGKLHEVTKLDLNCRGEGDSSTNLYALPAGVLKLTNLVELSLRANAITILPDGICNLKHLRKLDMHNNMLTALPENFGKLAALRELGLSHNALRTLPKGFANLENLKRLDLYSNDIRLDERLMETLRELFSLEELDIAANPNILSLTDGEVANIRGVYDYQREALKGLFDVLPHLWKVNYPNGTLKRGPYSPPGSKPRWYPNDF